MIEKYRWSLVKLIMPNRSIYNCFVKRNRIDWRQFIHSIKDNRLNDQTRHRHRWMPKKKEIQKQIKLPNEREEHGKEHKKRRKFQINQAFRMQRIITSIFLWHCFVWYEIIVADNLLGEKHKNIIFRFGSNHEPHQNRRNETALIVHWVAYTDPKTLNSSIHSSEMEQWRGKMELNVYLYDEIKYECANMTLENLFSAIIIIHICHSLSPHAKRHSHCYWEKLRTHFFFLSSSSSCSITLVLSFSIIQTYTHTLRLTHSFFASLRISGIKEDLKLMYRFISFYIFRCFCLPQQQAEVTVMWVSLSECVFHENKSQTKTMSWHLSYVFANDFLLDILCTIFECII